MLLKRIMQTAFIKLGAFLAVIGIKQMTDGYKTGNQTLKENGLQNILTGARLVQYSYLLTLLLDLLSDGGVDE